MSPEEQQILGGKEQAHVKSFRRNSRDRKKKIQIKSFEGIGSSQLWHMMLMAYVFI